MTGNSRIPLRDSLKGWGMTENSRIPRVEIAQLGQGCAPENGAKESRATRYMCLA